MSLKYRIDTLKRLRDYLNYLLTNELEETQQKCVQENSWFSKESIKSSLEGIIYMLSGDKIDSWITPYNLSDSLSGKKIGLVLAGNIPLVGFHDIISTYISGHPAIIKASSQDEYLVKLLVAKLKEFDASVDMEIVDKLKNMDAVIATGSDNSARYFEYYFGKYPHIIRKNRTSISVLSGEESADELMALGNDVLQYFGLGCRNVSKILIPENYDLTRLGDLWTGFHDIINHHKYANNYDYNKSIYLINMVKHLDYGYLLLKQDEKMVSPISVLFYDYYKDIKDAKDYLDENSEKIQCIVASQGIIKDSIPFGKAQKPELWDYADDVDTLEWLGRM